MVRTIDNTADVIDSRDFIERMEELQGERDALQEELNGHNAAFEEINKEGIDDPTDQKAEKRNAINDAIKEAKAALEEWLAGEDGQLLRAMEDAEKEASGSPDWVHGEAMIRESYFTDYIEELIKDCYPMPKELDSGNWPWRHVTIDYEAAAEEAKADYNEFDFDGVTYLIRA